MTALELDRLRHERVLDIRRRHRAKYADRYSAYHKAWRQRNPEKVRAYNAKRDRSKAGASKHDARRRVLPDGTVQKLCRYCERWNGVENLTRGGSSCREGVCSTCKDCARMLKKINEGKRKRGD